MLSDELQNANYISFATYKRSGDAVWTPVWAGSHGNSLFVFSETDSGKVKRLRNFSRAQVAPCTATGRITGNSYDAKATLLHDESDVKMAYETLHTKYGLLMRITDLMSKLSGRYNKRSVIRIDVGVLSVDDE